ncbi:MAG: hypothetical protein JXQ75_07380 [Phycisphaerae bacterium]|nr:hypothetical protein [Phycisphaerae bacterium]
MPPAEDYFDDDEDLPLERDFDESDDLPEIPCPSCGRTVTEDTQKCPYCGDWITTRLSSGSGWRRWVFVAAVLLMLYAILRWTF